MRESTPSSQETPDSSDGSLAVLAPMPPRGASAYVDFVFGLDYLSPNSPLLKMMQQAMAARGLSVLLVNKHGVEWAAAQARRGRLRPVVYLDLCSRPGDVFYTLLEAMGAAGVHCVCQPEQIKWTLKAYAHERLAAAGLPVPSTVVIGRGEADRELTAAERGVVGDRVVIKPSYGVAGLGVVVGAEPTRQAIAAAREYDRQDDWLIQRMIRWGQIDAELPKEKRRPAYLRAYNVLGHRSLMWWSGERGYSRLTTTDFSRYQLADVLTFTDTIARLTGMDFFSSEVAITSDDPADPNRFVLIDYINDQCDIDPSADPKRSPPAEWIRWICERFAEFTWRKKVGLPTAPRAGLFLGEAGEELSRG